MVLAHNAKQSRKCAETEIAGEEERWKSFGYRYVRWWSFCCTAATLTAERAVWQIRKPCSSEAGYTGKYRAAWEPDTDRKFL